MSHLDTLKAWRDDPALLLDEILALDAAISAMERLARARAGVEALPTIVSDAPVVCATKLVELAAVLALLDREES